MANTSLTVAQQSILKVSQLVKGNYVQDQLKNVLGKNAGTFATSLIELVTQEKSLQGCDPNALIQEAMKAATLNLPLNKQLGLAYIITFKKKGVPVPQFIIGYKGLIQLALRTGQYRYINADVVYEGELKSRDKLTGAIDLHGVKTSDKVVGFFAYIELLNGFCKTFYMTTEEMAHYAKTYSPSLKYNEDVTEKRLLELCQEQAIKGPVAGVVGWLGTYTEMARKTVLRQLIGTYGYVSTDMAMAFKNENESDAMEERNAANMAEKEEVDTAKVVEADAVEVVDTTTGEIKKAEDKKDDCPI
jgi:recombination protein RecT